MTIERSSPDTADKKLATDWYTWGFQAGMDSARSEPAKSAPSIESGARAIARSQGHDPDSLAPRTAMCTADNEQVPWWQVFEEQAEACLAAFTSTPSAARAQWSRPQEEIASIIAQEIPSLRRTNGTPGKRAMEIAGIIAKLSTVEPTASYCALCDLEHRLHEDAQGFHHVVKGERIPCATSVTSTHRSEVK